MATSNLNDLLKGLGSPGYQKPSLAEDLVLSPVAAPTIQTEVPAPTAPVAPTASAPTASREPTIAETLASIKDQALGLQSTLQSSGVTGLTQPKGKFSSGTSALNKDGYFPEEVDPDAEYKKQLKLHQAEIDATNMVYDQLLNEARLQGQGRLGTGRAIAARGGILGSDFAEAQKGQIQQYNTDINRSIGAERQAKIGSILGKVRDSALAAAQEKRIARQQGVDNYLKYLGDAQTRKTNNVKQLAQELIDQGFDPATMDQAELDAIATQSGLSVQEIISGYTSTKKAQEEAQAAADAKAAMEGRFTLSEGQAQYDAEGNIIASRAKTYAPKDVGESSGNTLNSGSYFVGQPNYSELTVKQKNQADSLNNLVRSLNEYKTYYEKNKGALGGKAGNLLGADSGTLQTMLNSIIFAAAQAEGTGALQKPDREVIEKIIPNPSSLSGAVNTLLKGGAEANITRIQNQIDKYTNNLTGYGLQPVLADPYAGGGKAVVQTGTLPNGTKVTMYDDGSIEDAQGNMYDEEGNPI